MWDPLLNEFPDSVHGFRCMLAIKYLQGVEATYAPDTVGYDLVRDLISVVRASNYAEACRRYSLFRSRIESTPSSQLRQPRYQPCCCTHCPRHKSKEVLDFSAYVPEAQDLPDVPNS
ncbi:precoat protein [Tomato yellow leaf curl Indonesia virus-[Lembang]]|uniref:Protein V2 n=1 Tax=Tomato yellow leaf curl Indonesia virus TaxID=1513531 RepID=Q9QD51_9GEMI|nr:precoat protein [Tomato yellow leaf curl Indonesia virus-[Lembang]]AAF01054.1 precoat protein [Tomato yellow leaf curl Indonesia virus-[Lembang]]